MTIDRSAFLAGSAATLGLALGASADAAQIVHGVFANGDRELVAFPQKRPLMLLSPRPPLLETPFAIFDEGVFTPNDAFFVRWHLADIPTTIDSAKHRITISGSLERPLSLSLADLHKLDAVEIAAVNQCSGNSRGFFGPRVAGGQWQNGAMGNAVWKGVRLKDVLDRAGLRADAKQVQFNGLEKPTLPSTPDFKKSLNVDIARAENVIIAYEMNGKPLPLLNGFPLRLIIPGWFSTYWVKMLSDIEVLTVPDDNFWMATAYRMPTVAVKPGDKGFPTVPITTMLPRSFITSHVDGTTVKSGERLTIRGIAMGGDAGVAKVEIVGRDRSVLALLEKDEGSFSFRRWSATVFAGRESIISLGTRCTNTSGVTQPDVQPWNPSGYARNVVEYIALRVA